MKLIVFLGNPGKQYRFNRHNIGFLSGEFAAQKLGVSINKNEFSSVTGKTDICSNQAVFLFPQTFMNKSGDAVLRASQFYKCSIEDIIVIHDELELPFGEIRVKKGGGHKGHNGIRSIVSVLNNSDFYRIRFGIGRPENSHISVADYVLSNFSPEERERLDIMHEIVYDKITEILCEG